MEFSIQASDLATAIGLVKSVVPSRTTIPVLNNICIKAGADGMISLTASSIDMQATSRERCEVVSEGETTIPGHALFGLAKGLPKSKVVTVVVDSDRANITCGRSSYDLGTLPADQFPIMPEDAEGAFEITVPAEDLASALSATIPTTSTLDDRPYMQGVHIRPDGGGLAFVSSDGHRFVRYIVAVEGADGVPQCIVPTDAARAIAGMCDEVGGTVRMVITPSRITAASPGASITSKLIAAKFPEYGSHIPAKAVTVRAQASELVSAVDRLSLAYSGTDAKQPLCVVSTTGDGIEIRSSRKSTNKGHEVIDGDVSRQVVFGVSVKYLSDAVKSFVGASTVDIQSAGGMTPIIVTSEDVPAKLFLVMPMNIAGEMGAREAESEAA